MYTNGKTEILGKENYPTESAWNVNIAIDTLIRNVRKDKNVRISRNERTQARRIILKEFSWHKRILHFFMKRVIKRKNLESPMAKTVKELKISYHLEKNDKDVN